MTLISGGIIMRECEFMDKCYIAVEFKKYEKYRVLYKLYCVGRKLNKCERREEYIYRGAPDWKLMPNGLLIN
jgi:hypothetical protein